jgi:predicted dehydrogenase
MIGHHKRFVPSVRKAKEFLDEGRIGKVRTLTGSMGLPRTWQSRSSFHLDPALSGGGVLIDNGVHLIDLVVWMLGSLTVHAGYTLPEGSPVELDAKIEFRSAHGAVGVLRFSHRAVLPNVMRIEGEQGFLEFDTYDYPSLKVFAEGASLCRKAGSVVLTWPRTSPYRAQVDCFVRQIRGTESCTLNAGKEAMEAVSVVTEVYNGARRPG